MASAAVTTGCCPSASLLPYRLLLRHPHPPQRRLQALVGAGLAETAAHDHLRDVHARIGEGRPGV